VTYKLLQRGLTRRNTRKPTDPRARRHGIKRTGPSEPTDVPASTRSSLLLPPCIRAQERQDLLLGIFLAFHLAGGVAFSCAPSETGPPTARGSLAHLLAVPRRLRLEAVHSPRVTPAIPLTKGHDLATAPSWPLQSMRGSLSQTAAEATKRMRSPIAPGSVRLPGGG
jgi:hypothetical protein